MEDIMPVLSTVGIIFAGAVALALVIYVIILIRRKTKVKQVTTLGTDKSDFAKQLMDEYHQERRMNEQE